MIVSEKKDGKITVDIRSEDGALIGIGPYQTVVTAWVRLPRDLAERLRDALVEKLGA